jgi:hypothetical protein
MICQELQILVEEELISYWPHGTLLDFVYAKYIDKMGLKY